MKKPILALLCVFFLLSFSFNKAMAQSEEFFFQYKGNALRIVDMALCEDGGLAFCVTKEVLQSYIVVKIDSKKQISWSKVFEVPPTTSGFKPTIAVKNNQVYISLADRINGGFGSYISKLDERGTLLWSKKWSLSTSSGALFEYPKKPLVTQANELILFQGLDHFSQVLKLDANGEVLFSKEIENDTMSTKNPGFDFRNTADGGYIMTSNADDNCIITKLTPTMEKQWSKRISFDAYNHPKAIYEFKNGNIMVGGYAIDKKGKHCFFTYVLDANGKLLNSNYYDSYFYPNQIAADGEKIRFSSQYGIIGELNEKGEILTYSKIDQNFFNYTFEIQKLKNSVVSFDNNVLYYQDFRNIACVETFDIVPNQDQISLNLHARIADVQLFVDNQGSVEAYNMEFKTISGVSFELTCSILSETKEEVSDENLIKEEQAVVLSNTQNQTNLTDQGPENAPYRMAENPLVYPNPFGTEIFVRNAGNYKYYQLYSAQGDLLKEGQPESSGINLSELTPGVYFLNLQDLENKFSRVKLIKQ